MHSIVHSMFTLCGRAATALLIAGAVVPHAAAQSYPTKPVRVVIGYPAGSGNDVIARLVLGEAGKSIGHQFIIDNRPGASGNIGVAVAARSPADGYTIAFAYSGTHAINPTLYPAAGFKNSDFAPVIWMMSVPQVLTVNAAVPAQNLQELIALAKSKPGQFNFASSAAFNQLAATLFNQMAGISMTHVPYTGGAASTLALLTGDVAMQMTDPPIVLPHLKTGKLRAVAVTSAKRSNLFPDLPSVAEAGIPAYEAISWNGVIVPMGTPPTIIARLNSEINKIIAAPDMKAKLAELGYEPIGGSPEQFGSHIAAESEKWGRVVKAANLQP